jgi:CDP-diacylglycerol--glycerol-3-phosphate 3-phosphatidyltransferase
LDSPALFIKQTTSTLKPLILPDLKKTTTGKDSSVDPEFRDTRVYMLAQMSQVMRPDSSTELPAITHVLKTLSAPEYKSSSWTFTAGYFNPAPSLTKLLLNTASSTSTASSPSTADATRPVNTVITAAPEANGFYKSPGVSGLLPGAYTLLARRFLTAIQSNHRAADISLMEWRKGTVGHPDGWTYHAKGLWVTLPGDRDPALSIIGSSNYTKRSYSLDLEVGALILTKDEALKKRLGEEQRWLQEYAKPVTQDDFSRNDRRVGLTVRVAMWIVKMVGGAL